MAPSTYFTFLVTTQNPQKAGAPALGDINAHIARYGQAKQKLRRKFDSSLRPSPDSPCSDEAGSTWHEENFWSSAHQWPRSKSLVTCRTRPKWAADRENFGRNTEFEKSPILCVRGLDPFLQLPLELSERDRWLLHFQLTRGRLMQRGSTQEGHHCPVLDICSALLQESKLLVVSLLIAAETFLFENTQALPTARVQYLALRFKAMLDTILSNPQFSIHRKVIGLVHMSFLQRLLGEKGTKGYLQQLDNLVEDLGGVSRYLTLAVTSKQYTILHQLIPIMYLLEETAFRTETKFNNAAANFIEHLRHVQTHSRIILAQKLAFKVNSEVLWPLALHLSHMIDGQLLTDDVSFVQASAAFYSCHHMCLTFTECAWTGEQILEYLIRLQTNFVVNRLPLSSPRSPLQTATNCNILSGIREDMIQVHQYSDISDRCWQLELDFAQAVVEGQKLFALMSRHVRSRLTRVLCHCALSICEDWSVDTLLTDEIIKMVAEDLLASWSQQQRATSVCETA